MLLAGVNLAPKDRTLSSQKIRKNPVKCFLHLFGLNSYPDIKVKPFICAKVQESRLHDMHPLTGGTRATFPEDDWFPPLESGLFSVIEVEKIESEDFGFQIKSIYAKGKRTEERDIDLQWDGPINQPLDHTHQGFYSPSRTPTTASH